MYDGYSQPQPMLKTSTSAMTVAALPQTATFESTAARGTLPGHPRVPDHRPPWTKKSATERSGVMRTMISVSSKIGTPGTGPGGAGVP